VRTEREDREKRAKRETDFYGHYQTIQDTIPRNAYKNPIDPFLPFSRSFPYSFPITNHEMRFVNIPPYQTP